MGNKEAHVPTEGLVIQKAISLVYRQHSIITISTYPTELTVRVFTGLCTGLLGLALFLIAFL